MRVVLPSQSLLHLPLFSLSYFSTFVSHIKGTLDLFVLALSGFLGL